MSGGSAKEKRRFKRAVERAAHKTTGKPLPEVMPNERDNRLGQKFLEFFEHPLFLLPAGIIGGIVGLAFYTPVLAICGLCFLAAFHRAKVVSGKPLWKQLGANVLLFLIIFGALLKIRSAMVQELEKNNLTPSGFARLVGNYVLNNNTKQPPDNPRIQESTPPIQPEIRSYLVFDGEPHLPTVPIGGQAVQERNFQVGDYLAFNLPFKQIGPNPIEMVETSFLTYTESDFELKTQKLVISDFEKKIRDGRRAQPTPANGPFAELMPDEHRFFTAFAANSDNTHRRMTQEDLDQMKSGKEIAFVLAQFIYRDHGIVHHLRKCDWLQPPAVLPTIWQACMGFYSD